MTALPPDLQEAVETPCHVHLMGWPPYVGGDDDEAEEWFGECCGCGWKGPRRKYQGLAYTDMLDHLHDRLRLIEQRLMEYERVVEAARAIPELGEDNYLLMEMREALAALDSPKEKP